MLDDIFAVDGWTVEHLVFVARHLNVLLEVRVFSEYVFRDNLLDLAVRQLRLAPMFEAAEVHPVLLRDE